jgi:hypothetical protein
MIAKSTREKMCDYMYYENKQRGKLKNRINIEEQEPELEKVEATPLVANH